MVQLVGTEEKILVDYIEMLLPWARQAMADACPNHPLRGVILDFEYVEAGQRPVIYFNDASRIEALQAMAEALELSR